MKIKFKKSLIFIVILILWQILAQSGLYSEYLLPKPRGVINEFIRMASDGSLVHDVLVSLKRVGIGFLIAFILSMFFASLFTIYPDLYIYFDGLFQFMKNIPPLSLIPLLILWFGIGEKTKIIIIVLASFFPLFFNIHKGFITVDNNLIEVGMIFGYSKFESFIKVTVPSALKDIFVGIRIALGYSFRAIIAAEMIAASSGLGYLINFSRQMSRTDRVIVGIIAIGIIGYLLDLLFVKFASRALKGDLRNEWYKS